MDGMRDRGRSLARWLWFQQAENPAVICVNPVHLRLESISKSDGEPEKGRHRGVAEVAEGARRRTMDEPPRRQVRQGFDVGSGVGGNDTRGR